MSYITKKFGELKYGDMFFAYVYGNSYYFKKLEKGSDNIVYIKGGDGDFTRFNAITPDKKEGITWERICFWFDYNDEVEVEV